MKRIAKCAVLFLCLTLVAGAFAAVAGAEEANGQKVTVSVRIEGITENLYYGTYEANVGDSVLSVFAAVDEASEDITITGLDQGYITAVNDDGSALTENGWDGWMYRVDGESPTVGMGDCKLTADTKDIVLYYSDEYMTGMQFPQIDTSDIENGKIKFTSKDTVYDDSGNPSVNENPVAGMTVVWGYGGGKTAEYTTDDNGVITIDKSQLEDGNHSLSVSREQNGIPTVLRFAPDFVVTIGDPETETGTAAQTGQGTASESESGSETTGNAETSGCKSVAGISVLAVSLVPGMIIVMKKKKIRNI